MLYYRKTEEMIREIKPNKEKVMAYLKRANLYEIGNVLVDVDKIIYGRWSCQPNLCKNISTCEFHGTCCDGGGIITPYFEKKVQELLPNIVEYLPKRKREILAKEGVLLRKYHINEIDDECIFLAKDKQGYFCSLHRLAEEKNIRIDETKPFDCCISPLEILILDNDKIFLTVVTKDNADFSRWGGYMECAENPLPNSPQVYQAMEYYIKDIFGTEFFEHMDAYYKKKC